MVVISKLLKILTGHFYLGKFYLISYHVNLNIYPPNLQESVGGTIQRASESWHRLASVDAKIVLPG